MEITSGMTNMRIYTSKKILFISYAMALTCLGVFIYTLMTENPYCSEAGVVFGLALSEVAVHTGFYSSKSKKENALKIAYDMIDKLADKYGIENVTNIFDSVNRD